MPRAARRRETCLRFPDPLGNPRISNLRGGEQAQPETRAAQGFPGDFDEIRVFEGIACSRAPGGLRDSHICFCSIYMNRRRGKGSRNTLVPPALGGGSNGPFCSLSANADKGGPFGEGALKRVSAFAVVLQCRHRRDPAPKFVRLRSQIVDPPPRGGWEEKRRKHTSTQAHKMCEYPGPEERMKK